jgi:predicted glycosyltransferase involved in capsule biosynthesis
MNCICWKTLNIKKFTSDDINTIDVLKAGREKRSDLCNDNSTYQDYTVLKVDKWNMSMDNWWNENHQLKLKH